MRAILDAGAQVALDALHVQLSDIAHLVDGGGLLPQLLALLQQGDERRQLATGAVSRTREEKDRRSQQPHSGRAKKLDDSEVTIQRHLAITLLSLRMYLRAPPGGREAKT
jgi:hypothetical protein